MWTWRLNVPSTVSYTVSSRTSLTLGQIASRFLSSLLAPVQSSPLIFWSLILWQIKFKTLVSQCNLIHAMLPANFFPKMSVSSVSSPSSTAMSVLDPGWGFPSPTTRPTWVDTLGPLGSMARVRTRLKWASPPVWIYILPWHGNRGAHTHTIIRTRSCKGSLFWIFYPILYYQLTMNELVVYNYLTGRHAILISFCCLKKSAECFYLI